ncbi:hypothetical protein D3C87_1776450 [compost metagenome]
MLQEGQVATAGWRGARDRVEYLAVLERVVRLARDNAFLVEVDGENRLLDQLRLHEGGGALALL